MKLSFLKKGALVPLSESTNPNKCFLIEYIRILLCYIWRYPLFFIPRIQMETHPDDHCPKGIVVIPADLQVEQMVIIQNPVIYALTGSAFFIDSFILLTAPRDPGRKSEIRINLEINGPSITALGTFRRAGAFFGPAAGQGTTVFVCLFIFIKAPAAHPEPGLAEGMPVFIQSKIFRQSIRCAAPAVDIDQGVDIPAIEQPVSRKIIMCGIQAEIGGRDTKLMDTESVYSIEEVDTVVPFGAGVIHKKWELNPEIRITEREHIERASVIPVFFMAVPAPFGIRVRIMPQILLPLCGLSRAFRGLRLFAIGICMDSNRSPVPGDGKFLLWDDAVFNRRKDCGEKKISCKIPGWSSERGCPSKIRSTNSFVAYF